MKATNQQLEQLLEIQRLELDRRQLLARAQELSHGGEIERLRGELTALSESLSQARLSNEELRRDLKRQEGDLQVVLERVKKDKERLKQSFTPKDIAGIQHELETLARRQSELEDLELQVMQQLEDSDRELHEIDRSREQKEAELEVAKEQISAMLAELKAENQVLVSNLEKLRSEVDHELLELFDRKFAKGIAVGRLQASTCLACNMSLNSLAMSDLAKIAIDEIANCPECGAILVRS